MADPYAFGKKDYTALDRRRKIIEDAMKNSFETNASIAQMQQQKAQRDRINTLTSVYSKAIKDTSIMPEQKVDLGLEVSSQLHGLGAHGEAEGITKHAQIYADLADKKQPRPIKQESPYLRTENLSPYKKIDVYGYKTPEGSEVITDRKPIDLGYPSSSGSDAQERINREKKRQLAIKARQLGIDINSINRGKYLFYDPHTGTKQYIGAYKAGENYVDATKPDVKAIEDPSGIEIRERKAQELEQIQQEINLLQAELGDEVTQPKNIPQEKTASKKDAGEQTAKKVLKKGYNKSTNQTQFIYGTSEIVDGKR